MSPKLESMILVSVDAIKCKQDGFYIEDNTSKFGTIILLKNKLRLKAHHTMAVQVGRTVISFTIKYV
jgi:hypothetical protein